MDPRQYAMLFLGEVLCINSSVSETLNDSEVDFSKDLTLYIKSHIEKLQQNLNLTHHISQDIEHNFLLSCTC